MAVEQGTGVKPANASDTDNKEKSQLSSEIPLLESSVRQEANSTSDGHASFVKHPTTYVETLINLVKGNTGAGMFAMGDAFKNAGLLAGPILTVFLGVICIYGNHILVNACKILREKRKLKHLPSFGDTVQMSIEEGPKSVRKWAQSARLFTFIFITITQLGFCSVYFVFISSTAKKILEPHGFSVNIHVFMVIILFPILLTALVRNLKYLTPFSFMANICLMSGIALTLFLSSRDLPHVSTRRAIAPFNRLPLFFGTTIYSFEGISLVLPLQNEMRNPKRFATPFGVLNIGMSLITAILISIGFIGYLKYGDDVKGSLALNFPQNEIFPEIVQIVISVGILLSYTLQFYVPVAILWPIITEKYGPFKRPLLAEEAFRISIVMTTFVIAESVPNLGLFISLVGAVCGTTLALIFPPICDIVLLWPSKFGKYNWRLVCDLLCLLVALVGLTTGCYYSLEAIVQEYM